MRGRQNALPAAKASWIAMMKCFSGVKHMKMFFDEEDGDDDGDDDY